MFEEQFTSEKKDMVLSMTTTEGMNITVPVKSYTVEETGFGFSISAVTFTDANESFEVIEFDVLMV